ncbi:MAG: methyltransferase domain-containing protein, partial [Gemmatimonadota bacterium]|nr:methyltransferase domain-containing protein [Gemmatimonadota bacterium]
MSYRRRPDCRGCGNRDLVEFLQLGPTPLANAFLRDLSEAEDEESYPLDLFFCPRCSLVQILDIVSPEVLFSDYIYVTGTSETIAEHNRAYARSLVEGEGLDRDALVVEVASNDGSLLRAFQPHGVRTLGVEPATNIAEMARAAGVETVNEFFDADRGAEVREAYGPARVVIGNNVFAHVDEPADFLVGVRRLLADGGLSSIEVPYLGDLLERREFDTVYHEHLSYFSVTALMHLYGEAGLAIERVLPVSVHGGSIRILARPAQNGEGHGE